MGWELPSTESKRSKPYQRPENLSNEDNQILDLLLITGEIQIDEISWRTQIPVNQLASKLLNLEFGGLVKSLPGKRFGINK
jgi:DNA processing protein